MSVAVGELADGLIIDLDAVRKKYEGLDGTELAISESQERMAVVVAPENEAKFIAAAAAENLEAYRVAVVTESPRMVMRWRGQTIADLSRAFLDTNGATKHASVAVPARECAAPAAAQTLRGMAGSLKSASRRGLVERFDSTVGAGTLLMPFGGRTQRSPAQAMAALLPVLPGEKTAQGSVMAWGCDPDALSADPYRGAHDAVYTSVAKLVAAGADYHKAYLSLQEFFEKLRNDPARWGKPFAALLGALDAQLELSAAAIGGKDSMSGSFLDRDVPPTLISFAIAPLLEGRSAGVISEAGVPGVADPGAPVVGACHRRGIRVVPLVGPSSIILAVMASGLNGQSFAFNGYLPVKPPERTRAIRFFERRALSEGQSQLFIEAPYRNVKLMEQLVQTLGDQTRLTVAVDLTAPDERIETHTAGEWRRRQLPEMNRRPAIFIIG